MTSAVALLGGLEHRPGSEHLDRHLLGRLPVDRPIVTILPLASSLRKRPHTIALAERYWGGLGAELRVAVPDRDPVGAVGAVDEADLVVLPGGDPVRLQSALERTRAWARVVERWEAGEVAVSGASAGAMVLAEWRPRLRPPDLMEMLPGLAIVRGIAVAPHYTKQLMVRRWAAQVTRRYPTMTILGIDEMVGMVSVDDDAFRVVGHGRGHARYVTVIRNGDVTTHADGDVVELAGALTR